jgi:hypothetical protein
VRLLVLGVDTHGPGSCWRSIELEFVVLDIPFGDSVGILHRSQ